MWLLEGDAAILAYCSLDSLNETYTTRRNSDRRQSSAASDGGRRLPGAVRQEVLA